MNAIKENDTFILMEPIIATIIGENRGKVLPAGTLVTIVLVFCELGFPLAYEVEAFLAENDIYVLATVEAHDAERIFKPYPGQ